MQSRCNVISAYLYYSVYGGLCRSHASHPRRLLSLLAETRGAAPYKVHVSSAELQIQIEIMFRDGKPMLSAISERIKKPSNFRFLQFVTTPKFQTNTNLFGNACCVCFLNLGGLKSGTILEGDDR